MDEIMDKERYMRNIMGIWSPNPYLDFTDEKLEMKTSKNKKVDLPERYIINENATILFWKDGTKTVVKKAKDDVHNPRLAFLTAFFQYYCGMSRNKANKYLSNLQVETKKIEKTSKNITDFKIGDRVSHYKYGKGTIVDMDNASNPAVNNILVEFDEKQSGLHNGAMSRNSKPSMKGHYYWFGKKDLTKEDK